MYQSLALPPLMPHAFSIKLWAPRFLFLFFGSELSKPLCTISRPFLFTILRATLFTHPASVWHTVYFFCRWFYYHSLLSILLRQAQQPYSNYFYILSTLDSIFRPIRILRICPCPIIQRDHPPRRPARCAHSRLAVHRIVSCYRQQRGWRRGSMFNEDFPFNRINADFLFYILPARFRLPKLLFVSQPSTGY